MDARSLYLSQLVKQAPIGICVIDAATLLAETVNEKFLEIAGKRRDEIIGHNYWETFAEVRFLYEAALTEVVETGSAFHAEEVEMTLLRNGIEENIIVTFTYELVRNAGPASAKVVVWVTEHTQSVRERKGSDGEPGTSHFQGVVRKNFPPTGGQPGAGRQYLLPQKYLYTIAEYGMLYKPFRTRPRTLCDQLYFNS